MESCFQNFINLSPSNWSSQHNYRKRRRVVATLVTSMYKNLRFVADMIAGILLSYLQNAPHHHDVQY
jgi:hypothetical protein